MKTVVVGGGHGAAASLRAALRYAADVAGIITVADDGGSSGRLARELGVLPMGDIRNCLAALAAESEMRNVFQHRFPSGPLEGHVVGNLLMAAVAQETGSFIAAIEHAASMLGCRGRIIPPTLEAVRLHSLVEGRVVEGQVAVATAEGRVTRVSIDPPDAKAYPAALDLLAAADQIVLGPGSLFTSVLPNLLVPEVREAYLEASGRKIYVCNLIAPPGETANFDAAAHLAAVLDHSAQGAVDVVVAHAGRRPAGPAPAVEVDPEALRAMGVEVATADLLPQSAAPRHDSDRLAGVLRTL